MRSSFTNELFRLALVGVTAACVVRCDCGSTVRSVTAEISVSPTTVNFGQVTVGTASEKPVLVSSTGQATLIIGGEPTLSTPDPDLSVPAAEFLVDDCSASPRSGTLLQIPAGDCARFAIQFAPTSVESIDDDVVISSNDPVHPTVKVHVTGSGIPAPAIPEIQVCVLSSSGTAVPSQCTDFTATPPVIPTLNLGPVTYHTTVTGKLGIFDRGNGPLSITALDLQTSSTDLTLPSPPTLPASVSAGGSADLAVSLTASINGTVTGTVKITSDDPNHPEVDIPVTASEESNGPTIHFTSPPLTQASPPLAQVSGSGTATVAVTSTAPLSSVVITFDNNLLLQSWMSPAASMTSFSHAVDWATTLGFGMHTLYGTATDMNGLVGKATLNVSVSCTADSQCPMGDRCCTTDGTCNPIVMANGDCDCDRPCPTDQGCFPGTCGQTPQQCRPGCNPGDEQTPAQVCTAPQNGQPAWCSPLQTGATTQNMGGACAPGDSCSVTSQNCPKFPLNRSDAESSSNPYVEYTCVPSAPGPPAVNECLPAGTTAAGATGCAFECGNDTTNCVKGYVCVQPLNAAEQPCGPSACQAQCADPFSSANPFAEPTQAPDCPRGYYCGQLLGNGFVPYATGVCTSMQGDPACDGI